MRATSGPILLAIVTASCGLLEQAPDEREEQASPEDANEPAVPPSSEPAAKPNAPAFAPPSPEPPPRAITHAIGDGCAIRASQLWCWTSPWMGAKQVSGIAAPISVSDDCALLESGAVICVDAGVPVEIPALKGVTAFSGAWRDLCGVRSDGTIVCSDRDAKVSDVEGISNAIDVAVGGAFGCAILRDRTVSCWGRNDNGQLGRKPPLFGADKQQAAQAVEGVTDIVELAASNGHVCARSQAGDVYCWGEARARQTGTRERDKTSGPTKVLANASAIAVGHETSCALVAGELICWGVELDGPTKIPGISNVTAIGMGKLGCVLHDDDRVRCWALSTVHLPSGDAVWRAPVAGARMAKIGLLGPIVLTGAGTLTFFDPGWTEALPELAGLTGVVEFDVEALTLCTVDPGAGLRCWNRPQFVEPKREWARSEEAPAVHSIAVYRDRGCGITDAGQLACWNAEEPPSVSKLGNVLGKLVDVAAVGHRCVVDARGKTRCFGPNDHGELGQGNTKPTTNQLAPKRLSGAVEVDSDLEYTCARTRAGTVSCWGGEFPHEGAPRPPHDVGVTGAVQLAVGDETGCARDEGGAIWCWRDWVDWEQEPPVAISEPPWQPKGMEGVATDIRMSGTRLCAVYTDEVRCWWAPYGPGGTMPIEVQFGG